MTDSALAMPLYHQVAAILRQRIQDSVYQVGERLIPEDELSAEFEVGRSTVRQAVGILVTEGLLTRRQGRGTFVKAQHGRIYGERFRGSLGDLVKQAREVSSRDIEIARGIPLPQHVADALNLTPAKGTAVRQTRFVNSEPIAHSISYLADSVGATLTVVNLRKFPLVELLMRNGVAARSATQRIRSELADVRISTTLAIRIGAPILFTERLVLDDESRPVDFVQTWCRGDRYEYTVDLELDLPDRVTVNAEAHGYR